MRGSQAGAIFHHFYYSEMPFKYLIQLLFWWSTRHYFKKDRFDCIKLNLAQGLFLYCSVMVKTHISLSVSLHHSAGPCMCLAGFPACSWTMCWSTGHPAVRHLWGRSAVRLQVRGCAVFGGRTAVFPGSPVFPQAHLRISALPSLVCAAAVTLLRQASVPHLFNQQHDCCFLCLVWPPVD